MAQMDIATYISQVVWLMVVYVGWQIMVRERVVPEISRGIKVREKSRRSVYSSTEEEEAGEVVRSVREWSTFANVGKRKSKGSDVVAVKLEVCERGVTQG